MSSPPPIPGPVLGYATPVSLAANTEISRDGALIVMPRNSMLPNLCVKCGEPVEYFRVAKKFYWHHPAFYVLLLSPIIYIIVALCVQKNTTTSFSLCEVHRKRRAGRVLIGWLLAVAGIAAVGLAIVLSTQNQFRNSPAIPLACLVGGLLILAAIIWGIAGTKTIACRRIDKYHAWFSGAGPEFLAKLPSV